MKKQCCIKGCKEQLKGAWIDVSGEDKKEGRWISHADICNKHFNIVYPYAQKKEKEEQEKWKKKNPKEKGTWHWVAIPVEIVNEALNQ